MKKLIIFLFIISLVGGSLIFFDKSEPIFAVKGVDEVCFVSGEKLNGEFSYVECGDKIFNFCTFDEAKEKAELLKSADAVQFYADEDKLLDILKKIKFQSLYSEDVDGIEICYGFTPCFADAVIIDGKKVNVQVAKREGRVVLGFPMIMTGY